MVLKLLNPLDLRLQASLTLDSALQKAELPQPFFTGDVAIAAVTSKKPLNGRPYRQYMEAEEGNVELFHPERQLSQIISRDFKRSWHDSASLVFGASPSSGKFVQQNNLLFWMPGGGKKDQVAFQDLSNRTDLDSPLYRLFHSPTRHISERFDETPAPGCPPPANLATEGSSFFNHIPVFALNGQNLLVHDFPITTAPMTLLILLDEAFHPHRQPKMNGRVPDRGPVDKHWFAIQELLDTADELDANHLSRRDFVRGVFNKANEEVFDRISQKVSAAMRDEGFVTGLVDYEGDLAREQGCYDEWRRRRAKVRQGWVQRLQQLDRLLQLSVHHHITRSPEPPSLPLDALSAYHPGIRDDAAPPQRRPKQQSGSPPVFKLNTQNLTHPTYTFRSRQPYHSGRGPPQPTAAAMPFQAGPLSSNNPWAQQPGYSAAPPSASPASTHLPQEDSYRLNRRLNPQLRGPSVVSPSPAQPSSSYHPDAGGWRQQQVYGGTLPSQPKPQAPYPVPPQQRPAVPDQQPTYPPSLLPGSNPPSTNVPPYPTSPPPFRPARPAYSPPPPPPAPPPAPLAFQAQPRAPSSARAPVYTAHCPPTSTPAASQQAISRPSSVASASSAGSGTAPAPASAPPKKEGPKTFEEMEENIPQLRQQPKRWWER